MNELEIKEALQNFLASNMNYEWNTVDESFVNVYQGELYGSDSIVTKTTKQRLSIELSVKFYSVGSLESIDNTILATKNSIDRLIKTIKIRNDLIAPLKALKFENWEKRIETGASSDSQVQYVGNLSMFYSLLIQGFD